VKCRTSFLECQHSNFEPFRLELGEGMKLQSRLWSVPCLGVLGMGFGVGGSLKQGRVGPRGWVVPGRGPALCGGAVARLWMVGAGRGDPPTPLHAACSAWASRKAVPLAVTEW